MFKDSSFKVRLRESISAAWKVFQNKVGNDVLPINKEASMQLQYAYILQQILPLIRYSSNETVLLELETGVPINGSTREIDLLLSGQSEDGEYVIAVEMKCYKKYASSRKLRGATDIFMKDVYQDLELLEKYCSVGIANQGVLLVMNDMKRLVDPKQKKAKCWDYDISNNTKISSIHLTTPIGGKEIDVKLSKSYEFIWEKCGSYWFMELEGFNLT